LDVLDNYAREDRCSDRPKDDSTGLRTNTIPAPPRVLDSTTDKAEGPAAKEDLGSGQTIGEARHRIYKGEGKGYTLVSRSGHVRIESQAWILLGQLLRDMVGLVGRRDPAR